MRISGWSSDVCSSDLLEPTVLPTRVPNLLVNGSAGIAVGMATNIPPHNLGEVIDATIALIADPEITIDDLMQHIPGPDFPTAGIINGSAGIHLGYHTGRGRVRMRARAQIDVDDHSGRESIIVSELPYMVNKERLIEKIDELVKEKRMEGISELRDEYDRSEEHTSELQSLMRISYAVFCLKKKIKKKTKQIKTTN